MDYDENVMAMVNAATPDRLKREGGVLTIDVGLGVGTVSGEAFGAEGAPLVTEAELAEVESVADQVDDVTTPEAETERATARLIVLARRLAAEVRRLTKAEQDAYRRGRIEAIEEAARYLEDVGGKKEDGVIIAAAGWITEHEAELNAKGAARGQ